MKIGEKKRNGTPMVNAKPRGHHMSMDRGHHMSMDRGHHMSMDRGYHMSIDGAII